MALFYQMMFHIIKSMLRKGTIYDSNVSLLSFHPCLFCTFFENQFIDPMPAKPHIWPGHVNQLWLFLCLYSVFFWACLFVTNQDWSKLVVVKNHVNFLFLNLYTYRFHHHFFDFWAILFILMINSTRHCFGRHPMLS